MARRAQIVVMEEDRNDARFLKQTFAKSAMGVPVRFVCDGRQAIKAMEGQGLGEHGLRLPTLVLLDLKVPVEQGFEVLAWLQSNERQCVAEAVVLSGLRRQEDIERAYRLGASSYLVKPRDENGFRTLVHALTTFWLENQFSGCGDRSLPCGPRAAG